MSTRCMSRWLVSACCVLASVMALPAHAERYAALLIEANTGQVLFERHARDARYPASLTKMMTLYLLFEALRDGRVSLYQQLPVSAYAAGKPQTNLALRAGDMLAVDTAIRALVVRSANDVATVVAEALGQTEFQFAAMMTAKARALGMYNTQFRNASGLPDAGQYSCAWDLYQLARALQRDFPQYYGYFSVRSFSHNGRVYQTHNRLVANYPGADGLKTGYVNASGFNLVTSAQRDGRRLIGVVLGGNSAGIRDAHMRNLLDAGFDNLRQGQAGPLQLAGLNEPAPAAVRAVAKTVKAATKQAVAATPKAVKARQAPAKATSGSGTRWGVQVGAFSSRGDAEKHARRVSGKSPALKGTTVQVSSATVRGKTVYRANLVGLNAREAANACQSLRKQKQACVALAPNS